MWPVYSLRDCDSKKLYLPWRRWRCVAGAMALLGMSACGSTNEPPSPMQPSPSIVEVSPPPARPAPEAKVTKVAPKPPDVSKVVPQGALSATSVGRRLNEYEVTLAIDAERSALEGNAQQTWRNPDNGTWGRVSISDTFSQGGHTCRQYRHMIVVAAVQEEVPRAACRVQGQWQVER